jgi:mono/diheme cytochrome c family protein
MKRWILIVLIALPLAAVLVIVGLTQIKLGALQEPGQLETVVASRAKHILVRWSSRDGIPPAPTNLQASIEEGDKLFGAECAACHGLNGYEPTTCSLLSLSLFFKLRRLDPFIAAK